jgi:hypothetical protein
MTAIADSVHVIKKPWLGIMGMAVVLVLLAVGLADLRQAQVHTFQAPATSRQRVTTELVDQREYAPAAKTKTVAFADQQGSAEAEASAHPALDAAAGRKIIRTSSLEMVVPHPADMADTITALAESLGGYLVSADSGGQDSTTATLTIRVPAARFEEARATIRKLGLRVENEKIQAQDVTQQYVDQDASIRNLHAEESQYLAILKQAGTVKDLVAVSQKLSEVRGQIEELQAEFNALSHQIETVAITISLRTEAEAQVFGLNWRPGYQLKLALRDGLESLATYATAMTTILFYLPATLLWMGTIGVGSIGGWRIVRWIGRRWFGWNAIQAAVRG